MTAKQAFIKNLTGDEKYFPILTGEPMTHGMRAGRVTLQPGQEIGLHSTKHHEELLTFLAGRGEVRLGDGTVMQVAVGQTAYIPPFTDHNVVNTSDEPFQYIFCVAPAQGVAVKG